MKTPEIVRIITELKSLDDGVQLLFTKTKELQELCNKLTEENKRLKAELNKK